MRLPILVLLVLIAGCAGEGPRYSNPNDCPPRLRVYYPDYKPCAPVDAAGPEGAEKERDRTS